MAAHLDLSALREMTDGDAELEQEIFAEFLSAAEECLVALSNACVDGENESYRTNAHAFKGLAVNLGALPLGDLCRQAQEASGADAASKQAIYQAITAEYNTVKSLLKQNIT